MNKSTGWVHPWCPTFPVVDADTGETIVALKDRPAPTHEHRCEDCGKSWYGYSLHCKPKDFTRCWECRVALYA